MLNKGEGMAINCPRCDSDNPDTARFCSICATPLPDVEGVVLTKTLETPVRKSLIGTTISDKYKITGELGEGGMGIVYRAEDTKLQRTAALKFLPPELTRDQEARERFVHEARAASALDHNNICTIYEIAETEDEHVYISMAYYDGESLKDKIKHESLKYEEAVDIAIQVAKGLSKAHSQGIVHRDIKPANIMITNDNVAKILDFGLAKLTGQVRLTRTGATMGTVAYMSPEQTQGEEVDFRSDIWSLGVVMYEMFTGELPFQGEHEQSMMYSITNKEPYPMRKLRPDLPDPLEQIVATTLAKNPEERYQNIDDLIDDLESVLEGMEPLKTRARRFRKQILGIRQQVFFIGVVAIAILIVLAGISLISGRSSGIGSIAVLPFHIKKVAPELEYLGDEIPGRLIDKLGKISDLKVIGWFSASQYRGMDINLQSIGQDLKVESVLLGQLEQRADNVFVNLELINVKDNSRIWGNQYQQKPTVTFRNLIETEIPSALIQHIKPKLAHVEAQQLVKHPSENEEAYDLYLVGQHFIKQYDLQKGLEYLNRAIAKDPEFALPHASLTHYYALLAAIGLMPVQNAYPIANSMATRALELDTTSPEAHASSALVKFLFEWDWEEAEKEYNRAIELNPNRDYVPYFYTGFLSAMLRFEEAIDLSKKSIELDPLSPEEQQGMGWSYLMAGKHDEAIAHYEKAIELQPDHEWAHTQLAWVYGIKGQKEEAIIACKKAEKIYKAFDPWAYASLAWIYGNSGEKEKTLEILEELKEHSSKGYINPWNFAFVYMGLGDDEKALEFFEKAFEERSPQMVYFNIMRLIFKDVGSDLGSHPRYLAILEKMGFETK